MKIALIGPVYPYRGGIAHYTAELSRSLKDHGHALLLISFKRQYPQWLFPGKNDRDESNEPIEAQGAHYWLDTLNPFTWIVTFGQIKQYKPDIIVLQWWTTFFAPIWLLIALFNFLFLHSSLVFICHNVLPHERRWWDKSLARCVLFWSTLNIVQSEKEKQLLHSLLPAARITVVPMPLFDMFAKRQISKADARLQLDIPLDIRGGSF
ncbi:glycosyltransferase [Chloroflexi bacterium TSY]|nr:glycosyltransferase [Chloroflexi bacterium TSY]